MEERACHNCKKIYKVPIEEIDQEPGKTYWITVPLPDEEPPFDVDHLVCPNCDEAVAERVHVDDDDAEMEPWEWEEA